jgi:hypothetical protein
VLSLPLNNHTFIPHQASAYFYLPIDDEPHLGDPSTPTISHSYTRSLSWKHAEESSTDQSDDSVTRPSSPISSRSRHGRHQEITDILEQNDLYNILGLSRAAASDKMELRRAYLSRSRACHPEYIFPHSRFHFHLCVETFSFAFRITVNFLIILKQHTHFKRFPWRIMSSLTPPQDGHTICTPPHMSFLATSPEPLWVPRRR